MKEIKMLYEDAKSLTDKFIGISYFLKHREDSTFHESKRKALKYKTYSVILQDKYLESLRDEELKDEIPIIKDVVK